MHANLIEQLTETLRTFSSASRLYALTIGGDDRSDAGLLVEAFVADEAVQGVGVRDVIALSINAHLRLDTLLGKPARLEVSLSDGTRTAFAGDITAAASLGSNGGLARYRLRLSSWVYRLTQCRNSRAWEDKSALEIVDEVLASYAPLAVWRWSDEVAPFMAGACSRSFRCQYRESDHDFLQRLLAEEGLGWRFEDTPDGPCMVLFADSSAEGALPEDATSARAGGVALHGAGSVQREDTVLAMRNQRSLGLAMVSLLSYDYKTKQVVAASAPSTLPVPRQLPMREAFDAPGQYAYTSAAQARRYADLQIQGHEARSQPWWGRSNLRTLRAGTRLTISGLPLQQVQNGTFSILRVTSVGINNLPAPAQQALAELFGPLPELLQEGIRVTLPDDFALALQQAQLTGYGNCFEACMADVIWRPQLHDSAGRSRHRPTAGGSQTAIVVGADGNDQASGADELYCDRLGRVRIRFHWQERSAPACWVRVAQRSTGGGMGSQFLPRIGQEVLVQFLDNDIDRPVIVGALYNGQGEGGIAPTPGGGEGATDEGLFAPSTDQRVAAQANLAAGNSPLWHGAAADSAAHRNGAAQWGVRSKEFGGQGYSQLLFDDTDAQGRVQLRCSHAATELNMGHLVHAADNYRGSLRGHGAELRTDAYGAVRAGGGLLVTSYKAMHAPGSRDPAGDNAAGITLLKQAVTVGEAMHQAALSHQTVGLAAHTGAREADASTLDEKAAPLRAAWVAVSGMVSMEGMDAAQADAAAKETHPDSTKLPHATDPLVTIAARAGLAVAAGQAMQLASGETVTVMSGQDSQMNTGGQLRAHSGQAIGLLGGAMQADDSGAGLQLVAAKGALDIQAQADTVSLQGRDIVNVVSANAHIDWAAAKSISLSTAGGANITITGGNITVQCPGKITIHAGKKSFTGPDKLNYPAPKLPRVPVTEVAAKFDLRLQDAPGPTGVPLPLTDWRVVSARDVDSALTSNKLVLKGQSDDEGKMTLSAADEALLQAKYNEQPNGLFIVYESQVRALNLTVEKDDWTDDQKRLHAMDAMGYSDDFDTVGEQHAQDFHARLAGLEAGVRSGSSLLNKIKG
jgi:type VI secretion system secreted protein VgrG